MRSRRNKMNFLKPACCWVLSLALVFSMAGTPAFAAEAVEAAPEATPAVTQSSDKLTVLEDSVTDPVKKDDEQLVDDSNGTGDEFDEDVIYTSDPIDPEPGTGDGDPLPPESQSALRVSLATRVLDANDFERSFDAPAQVGDTAELIITLVNMGEESINDVAVYSAVEGLVPAEGPWGYIASISAGEVLEFTARYDVTASDGSSVELSADVSSAGNGVKSYTAYVEVEHPVFNYTVRYYKDYFDGYIEVGEGSNFLGSFEGTWENGAELTALPEDVLNFYLPEGYVVSSENGPWTLRQDSDNVVEVVYELAPEPEVPVTTAPYTIYYRLIKYDSSNNKSYVGYGFYTGEAEIGSTVTLEAGTDEGQIDYLLPQVGYYSGEASANELVISKNAASNFIEVDYAPKTYAYTVYFLCEGSDDVVGTLEGEWYYGSTVHYDAAELNQFLPESRYVERTSDLDFTIIAEPGTNVAYVTYQYASYNYELRYYKDFVDPNNLLGTHTNSAKYGQTVYALPLSMHCPDGYRLTGIDRTVTISDDESQNVVEVVYEKRDDIVYTVNYFQDDHFGKPIATDHGVGTLGEAIPYTAGKYCPNGYSTTPELTGAQHICPYGSSNVLNVVYANKGEYGYEVRYYKDSVDEKNLIGEPVTGMALYGAEIPYELDAYVPAGYTSEDALIEGARIVSSNAESNVLKIIFSKDQAIPYIVNYYLGSLDGELVGKVAGTAPFQSAIPFNIREYLRPGYSSQVLLSGRLGVSANAADNVLNVVMPRAEFAYTVNYYRGSIAEENLITSVEDTALYLDPMNYDATGSYAPEGYETQGTLMGPTSVSYDESANVLNIVYAPKSFTYTVNYYRGSAAQGQLIKSVTYEPRSFGTHVDISADELNAQLPEGFAPVSEGLSFDISADQQRNVKNVSFTPDFTEFYSASIMSLDTTYDGAAHYVTPRGVVAGDIITYTYNGARQTRVVGSDANIGAEFREQTDGALPVLVTVTRGGITSNAVRTTVRIGPAPVLPVDPTAPSQAMNPTAPGAQDVSTALGNAATTLPVAALDAQETTVATIGPADVIANALANVAGIDTTGAQSMDGTSIDDDATPLAALDASKSLPMALSGVGGYLFMLLAAACLIVMLGLLVMRKRMIEQISTLKTSEAVLHQSRVQKMTRSVVVFGIAALVFCLLWGVFLL